MRTRHAQRPGFGKRFAILFIAEDQLATIVEHGQAAGHFGQCIAQRITTADQFLLDLFFAGDVAGDPGQPDQLAIRVVQRDLGSRIPA